jgi:hypothetical protein
MNRRHLFLAMTVMLALPGPVHPQAVFLEGFEDEVFQLRQVSMGPLSEGANQFTAVIRNKSRVTRYPVIDIRTECNGLSMTGWQKQFYLGLAPGEHQEILLEYQINSPFLSGARVRFGEIDRPFDPDAWVALSPEERARNPRPEAVFFHETAVPEEVIRASVERGLPPLFHGEAHLTPLSDSRLAGIREALPSLLEEERMRESPLRKRLRDLVFSGRQIPSEFEPKRSEWPEGSRSLANLDQNGIRSHLLTLRTDGDNRLTAFFATDAETADVTKPLILILGGNPGGVKERLVGRAIYLAQLGYHVVGLERRESARLLDRKEKFLTNFTDPVFDALRLLEFLRDESDYPFSGMGIFGTSAGAVEGRLIAALDPDIHAAVLVVGTSSHDDLFRGRAWIPTFSGMIIYPELGLGSPAVGQLSSEEYWREFEKARPEHAPRAREVFRDLFPFFEDLDPVGVAPLVAPTPLLIVTGARDSQFRTEGAVAVDRAARAEYQRLGIPEAQEHHIQPRTGHSLDSRGAATVTAFLKRWLG